MSLPDMCKLMIKNINMIPVFIIVRRDNSIREKRKWRKRNIGNYDFGELRLLNNSFINYSICADETDELFLKATTR